MLGVIRWHLAGAIFGNALGLEYEVVDMVQLYTVEVRRIGSWGSKEEKSNKEWSPWIRHCWGRSRHRNAWGGRGETAGEKVA